MALQLFIPKESRPGERRVALSPDVAKSLIKKNNFQISMESGAGAEAYFLDEAYKDVGVQMVDKAQGLSNADVVLKVNAPTIDEAKGMKEGAVSISFLYAYTQPELLEAFNAKKISAFSMDAVPRISRAQKMDAKSSQDNLSGYKTVILGALNLGKIFPLMMTAAGTITPAKVLIFGAGVAGLQAVATAKRLGANVEVTDVRPETKEQVESLGGKFLEVEGEGVETEGGYAKEVSDEYLKKQTELINKTIKDADIVITTALVIGKKAPVLVTEEQVKSMKPGSVVVDMAVESGGNCALSEMDKTVTKHNVVIVGQSNLPSTMPINASELYAKNISTLLTHLADENGFKWEMEEEVTKGSLITHQGQTVHEFTKDIIAKNQS